MDKLAHAIAEELVTLILILATTIFVSVFLYMLHLSDEQKLTCKQTAIVHGYSAVEVQAICDKR